MFQPAELIKTPLRMAIYGPAGCGKTLTALLIAREIVGPTGKIALIDTEHGSSTKHARRVQFDVTMLTNFHPARYIEAIQAAQKTHDLVIVDSMSHCWSGRGGVLQIVDAATARSRAKNSFTDGWSVGTPVHQDFLEAILGCTIHIICTMRSKEDYLLIQDENGRITRIQRVGLAPIQRTETAYEFDLVGRMDCTHTLDIDKERYEPLAGRTFHKPGADLGRIIRQFLDEGVPGAIPAVEPLTALVERLRLLRDAERQALGEPEPFSWNASKGAAPLEQAIRESRERMIAAIVAGAGGNRAALEQLSDDDLIANLYVLTV